jgi:hypothetical protein
LAIAKVTNAPCNCRVQRKRNSPKIWKELRMECVAGYIDMRMIILNFLEWRCDGGFKVKNAMKLNIRVHKKYAWLFWWYMMKFFDDSLLDLSFYTAWAGQIVKFFIKRFN